MTRSYQNVRWQGH